MDSRQQNNSYYDNFAFKPVSKVLSNEKASVKTGNTVDDELTSSLVYNLLKKIELRTALNNRYIQQKASSNDNFITKYYLHSYYPLVYICLASLYYLIPTKKRKNLSFLSIIVHAGVAVSINQFEKYRNTMLLDPNLTKQYQQFSHNYTILLKRKSREFSYLQYFNPVAYITEARIQELIRARII